MKALKKILISLIAIVLLVAVALVGVYVYVLKKYEIDLLKTANQLKTLSQDVDEATLCPNAFGVNDFASLKTDVNKDFDGLIVQEDGKGYNGYSVNFDALKNYISAPKSIVRLKEKQVGALSQTVFYSQTEGVIKFGEREVSVTVVQIDFSDIATDGSADFNVVAKLDLTSVKADMKSFPYSTLKKYIPDELYVSSTVRINKTGDDFGYTLEHKSLTINNLTKSDTDDLFHTIDVVLKIGSAEDMNMQIGKTVVGALIGTEQSPGFAYSFKVVGATTFNFVNDATLGDMFVIE